MYVCLSQRKVYKACTSSNVGKLKESPHNATPRTGVDKVLYNQIHCRVYSPGTPSKLPIIAPWDAGTDIDNTSLYASTVASKEGGTAFDTDDILAGNGTVVEVGVHSAEIVWWFGRGSSCESAEGGSDGEGGEELHFEVGSEEMGF